MGHERLPIVLPIVLSLTIAIAVISDTVIGEGSGLRNVRDETGPDTQDGLKDMLYIAIVRDYKTIGSTIGILLWPTLYIRYAQ